MAYAQQTLQAIYTVPNNKDAFLIRGMASTGKGKDAQIFFKIKINGGVYRLVETFGIYQNTYEAERPFIRLPEQSDLKVTSISSSAGTDVSAQFGLLLLDKDIINY